jgi:hypothetical protein
MMATTSGSVPTTDQTHGAVDYQFDIPDGTKVDYLVGEGSANAVFRLILPDEINDKVTSWYDRMSPLCFLKPPCDA